MAEKKMARGFSPPFSPVFFIILINNPPKNKATALQAINVSIYEIVYIVKAVYYFWRVNFAHCRFTNKCLQFKIYSRMMNYRSMSNHICICDGLYPVHSLFSKSGIYLLL